MISGILGQSPECQKIWFLLLFFFKFLETRSIPRFCCPGECHGRLSPTSLPAVMCWCLIPPAGFPPKPPPHLGGGPADGEGPGAQPGLRPAAVGGGLPQCQAPPARGPVLAWEGPARPPQPLRGEPRDRPPGPVCSGPFLGGGQGFPTTNNLTPL